MTKMATDPLLFFVAIFVELAIFEVGHILEDALKYPEKYEDGHEIAVREIEGEVFPGNEAKMATWYEDGHQKKQGHVGQVRIGRLRSVAIGTPEKKTFSETPGGTVAVIERLSCVVQHSEPVMEHEVTISHLRDCLGVAYLHVVRTGEPVVVQRYGKTDVALVPLWEWRWLKAIEEAIRSGQIDASEYLAHQSESERNMAG